MQSNAALDVVVELQERLANQRMSQQQREMMAFNAGLAPSPRELLEGLQMEGINWQYVRNPSCAQTLIRGVQTMVGLADSRVYTLVAPTV
jgi:hypothetical protein